MGEDLWFETKGTPHLPSPSGSVTGREGQGKFKKLTWGNAKNKISKRRARQRGWRSGHPHEKKESGFDGDRNVEVGRRGDASTQLGTSSLSL